MRDYFIEPAQTNLELYAQVVGHEYSPSQRARLAGAYQFALRQVFPLARGSGKPFIAHLVGTASLVLASGCPADWVIAALLHASYQRRVPFTGGLPPDARRPIIADRFGRGVDELIHRYTACESRDLGYVAGFDTDTLTLRLADELEDLCGHALALHGTASSDERDIRGSCLWRQSAKTKESGTLLETAQRLGLEGIARGFTHWLDFSTVPAAMKEMRTGWFSSVDLTSTVDE